MRQFSFSCSFGEKSVRGCPNLIAPLPPLLQANNTTRPNVEEGINQFSTLLNNKHFLITFVHALEQQKDFAVRDR